MRGFGYASETLAFLELCSCMPLPFAFTLLGRFSNTEKWDKCAQRVSCPPRQQSLGVTCLPFARTQTPHVTSHSRRLTRHVGVCVSLCASGTGLTSSRFPCDLLWPVGYLR